MSIAIKITNLSKRYRIGNYQGTNQLKEFFLKPFKLNTRNNCEYIWALKNINLEVEKGEIIGIIGRNGGGKSTLLKILSRITSPTEGSAEVFGRMASLLEVGTGFHGELTGRENIYLNGSILGMSREEISKSFDQIVAFSEVERFIDTPVKRYSSGMYVRLAFAVAAHLNPEILIIDEVLSVGDLPFKKKCIEKMDSVAQGGRTVLFVSHNLLSIKQLCPRSILIEEGKIIYDGPTNKTLDAYRGMLKKAGRDVSKNLTAKTRDFSGKVRFSSYIVEDSNGSERFEFMSGEKVTVTSDFEVFENVPNILFYFALLSEATNETLVMKKHLFSDMPVKKGFKGKVKWSFSTSQLVPRDYLPYLWVGNKDRVPYDRIDYSTTMCPPIQILSEDFSLEKEHEGYFIIPSTVEVSSI